MLGRIAPPLAATVTAVLCLNVAVFSAETTVAAEPLHVLVSAADTRIVEDRPTTNYGGNTTVQIDGDDPSGTGKDKSGLIKWDLSNIPAGSKISSASVTLNVANTSVNTYQAYALKRSWVESSATWNLFASASPWEIAGAKGSLDRETTVAGSVTPSTTGKQTFSLSPEVVQRWVDNPATNQGIIIANSTNADGFDFSSRNNADASLHPQLTVNLEGATDTAPPETTIDSGPSGTVNSTSASLAFSSSEPNSTFECRLDGAAFSSCTSPRNYVNLSDGSHTFEVRATDAAGNTDATPASRTWVVDSTLAQNDPTFVGAGDIANDANEEDEATAKLLDGISGTVFTAGDNAYNSGTATEFANYYHPTWGRHKARIKPTPGNHEYLTAGASGYFSYFGAAAGDPSKGYYSYDLGEWHIVALNSNCENTGDCGASSQQVQWLKADLAANPRTCTLAYSHHPLFSSGQHGNQTQMRPIWDALYAADADVVIAGHDHNYERFAPQRPDGTLDTSQGIREFVVGTGGIPLRALGTVKANSEVRNSVTHGVLKLTLHPSSYDWQFIPVAGKTFTDSGSGQCHEAPGAADTTPPMVSSVAPAEGATDVAAIANTEVTFSEAMDPNTITTTTFTLVKQGASEPLTAQVSYDAATKKATLDPNADLDPSTTYLATVKGGATGVKDLAGNALATDKVWSFTTAAAPLLPLDNTAPETNIDSGPSGTVNSTSASFAFSSSEPNSTFECRLDGAAFSSCTSPKSYADLPDGSHTFEVRAIDAAGNVDPTPASRTWTVETVAPALPATPSGLAATAASTSRIDLRWTDNATNETAYVVERSPDGSTGWAELSSTPPADTTSYSDTGLSTGTTYHYRVKATNQNGSSSYSNTASATTNANTDPLFSDDWTGAEGASWNGLKWSASGTTSGTLDIRSNQGRMRFENVSGARALAIASMPGRANTEVLMSFRFPSTSAKGYLQVYSRASGNWVSGYPSSGYYLEISNSSSNIGLRKVSSGRVTDLSNTAAGQATTQKQWVRFRIEGSTLKAKVWTEGTPEPSAWETQATDASFSAPGVLQLKWSRSSTATAGREVYLDDLKVADM